MEQILRKDASIAQGSIAVRISETIRTHRVNTLVENRKAFGPSAAVISESFEWGGSFFARPALVRNARASAVQEAFNLAVREMSSSFGTQPPQDLLAQARPHTREFLTHIANFARYELGPGTQDQTMTDLRREILDGPTSATARLRAKIKLSLALLEQIKTPRAYDVTVLLRDALEPVSRAFRVELSQAENLLKNKQTENWAEIRRELFRPQ